MPRGVRRTRYPAVRQLTERQRQMARKVARRFKRLAPSSGKLILVRKPAIIRTSCSPGITGVITVQDPTGNCLAMGTPVLIVGSQNCYDIPFSMTFNLNQCTNANELTVLFDRYRILSALVRVHYNVTNSSEIKTMPWIEYVQDYDDNTVPSIATMREKMGSKTKFFGTNKFLIKMGVRPRFADTVYQSGVTSAYGIGNRNEFLNTSYPAVEHYGIKGILHNVPLSGAGTGGNLFDFDVSLKLSLKDIQ